MKPDPTSAIPTFRPAGLVPAPAMTRRLLATGAALMGLAGVGTAAHAGAVHPDAELIRLGAELEAAWARQDAAAELAKTDEELEELMRPAEEAVERIEHLPAYTLAGLLVKARAVSWCNCGEEIDPDRFCPFQGAATDGRIAASIVRDLLGKIVA